MKLKHAIKELTLHERMGVMYQRIKDAPLGAGWAWMILGGTAIAVAEEGHPQSKLQQVFLQYHGGRKTWMIENAITSPDRIFPRDDHFGSLPQMFAKFEEIAGLKLPEVTLSVVGRGVVRVNADGERWDAGNPWELAEGAVYSTVNLRGREHFYEAVPVRGKMELRRCQDDGVQSLHETFDPSLVFTGDDWERIRRVGPEQQTVSAGQVERARG